MWMRTLLVAVVAGTLALLGWIIEPYQHADAGGKQEDGPSIYQLADQLREKLGTPQLELDRALSCTFADKELLQDEEWWWHITDPGNELEEVELEVERVQTALYEFSVNTEVMYEEPTPRMRRQPGLILWYKVHPPKEGWPEAIWLQFNTKAGWRCTYPMGRWSTDNVACNAVSNDDGPVGMEVQLRTAGRDADRAMPFGIRMYPPHRRVWVVPPEEQ